MFFYHIRETPNQESTFAGKLRRNTGNSSPSTEQTQTDLTETDLTMQMDCGPSELLEQSPLSLPVSCVNQNWFFGILPGRSIHPFTRQAQTVTLNVCLQ
jgi:hypothetical protein